MQKALTALLTPHFLLGKSFASVRPILLWNICKEWWGRSVLMCPGQGVLPHAYVCTFQGYIACIYWSPIHVCMSSNMSKTLNNQHQLSQGATSCKTSNWGIFSCTSFRTYWFMNKLNFIPPFTACDWWLHGGKINLIDYFKVEELIHDLDYSSLISILA